MTVLVSALLVATAAFAFWLLFKHDRARHEVARQQSELRQLRQELAGAKTRLGRFSIVENAEAHAAALVHASEVRAQLVQVELETARREFEVAQAVSQSQARAEIAHARAESDAKTVHARAELDAEKRLFDQHRELATASLQSDVERTRKEYDDLLRALEDLRGTYRTSKATYDRLLAEVASVEENLEDISFGLYKPHFDFATTEEYKAKLNAVYEAQKAMIRDESAAVAGTVWTVGNSRREGERMQKQYSKLILRAFNGECESATASVAWNNIVRMEQRITKAFEAINKLGSTMQISIAGAYCELKLDELHLEFELEQRKHEEAEEQRRIREQMRDEERAQKEIERAQRDAEEEESRYQKSLERARRELANARSGEVDGLAERVRVLEAQLLEAHTRSERMKSMAEQTRRGYVYIISNHGSFGDGVIKIGMTRRLDPMDRVRELGDASVPFEFDVHAMAFSEDAPALENTLHRYFSQRRVNRVNFRKEFFRVSLTELQDYATSTGLTLQLTMTAEARQYRETLARIEAEIAAATGRLASVPARPAHELFPEMV